MKPKSKREKKYDRLTYLTMLKEEMEHERMETIDEDVLPENDGDWQNSDGDESDDWEPLNDVHGLLALDEEVCVQLE